MAPSGSTWRIARIAVGEEELAPLAGEALEDGAVLAVHGQQRGPVGPALAQHQGAGHHQHLLVRERHVAA